MMPTFTLRASTVIPELELHTEVFPAKKRHRCLEVVARGRGDAYLGALNRRLDFLALRFLDPRRNLLRGISVERHLEGDVAVHGVAAAGLDLSRIQVLYG